MATVDGKSWRFQSGADRHRPGYLTVREAAERLNMHFMSVYKLVQTGELPAAKIGSRWKIDPDQLDGWIARQGGTAHRWVLLGPEPELARRLREAIGGPHEIDSLPFSRLPQALGDDVEVLLIDAVADSNTALAALAAVHARPQRPLCVLLVDEPTRALVVGALDVGLVCLLSVSDLDRVADEVGAVLHWT